MEFNGRRSESSGRRSMGEHSREGRPMAGRGFDKAGSTKTFEGRQGRMDSDHRQLPTRQQTQCRFCRRGNKYVDYKDIETLQKLLTHRGKINTD